jgi:hypothetical protein
MSKLKQWITTGLKAIWTALVAIVTAPFKAIIWLWKWWTTKPTFKVTVSYDSKFGNMDDVVYEHVPKIVKSTWKELSFITAEKKTVNVKASAGLNYRIEEE